MSRLQPRDSAGRHMGSSTGLPGRAGPDRRTDSRRTVAGVDTHQGVFHQGHPHAPGEDAGVYDQGHCSECGCGQGVYHQGHPSLYGPGTGVYHQGHDDTAH
ncbi:MAG: hypothetical protein QOD35_3142 [Nocardioidaceae bacterium]|nr:hypothetical protein [Nocardioidaceae bacterium]